MLNQLLGNSKNSIQISKARIEEIFEVPRTKEKWNRLLHNRKFRTMMIDSSENIQAMLGYSLTNSAVIESNMWQAKTTILQYAFFFIANEGISLNKGVQKSCDFILREIQSTSEERIDQIIQEFFQYLFEEEAARYNYPLEMICTDTIM